MSLTFGSHRSSIHGPVPTTDSAFLRSPNFSTHSLATIQVDVEASMSRNHAFGPFSVNFTVCLSRTSILSTNSSTGRLPLPLTVRKRSYVYLTSSAVSSRPFTGGLGCQRTPLRSLKTYVRSFGWDHDSARSGSTGSVPGTTLGPAFTLTSRLCVNERFVAMRW